MKELKRNKCRNCRFGDNNYTNQCHPMEGAIKNKYNRDDTGWKFIDIKLDMKKDNSDGLCEYYISNKFNKYVVPTLYLILLLTICLIIFTI